MKATRTSSWTTPVGLVLVLLGLLWGAQGIGWIGGSSMSDNTLWAVVGPIVVVLGAAMVVLGLRRSR